jgi:hypothetical protein
VSPWEQVIVEEKKSATDTLIVSIGQEKAIVDEAVDAGSADEEVGRCRLTVSKSVSKAPMVQRLKVYYDVPLSNFAFEFNLRHCNEACAKIAEEVMAFQAECEHDLKAGANTRSHFSST